MSILVTGGAGYIGSHMVLELVDKGQDVIVLDNLSTGFRWAVHPRAKLVVGNVRDASLVAGLLQKYNVHAIIHFAGSIVVPESVADPLAYYQNNTCASRGLIAAAVAHKVKHFIFSSTAAVYGNPEQSPVGEDAPLAPISPYGSSKMMTEMMLRDTAAAHELSYVALRYFNVAGADPDGRGGQSTPRATHLIKVAAEVATGKRDGMQIFGTDYATEDGTCVRDYIHVSDLARAHSAALEHLTAGGESLVLNCGYGRGYSVRDVVDMVQEVSGKEFRVEEAGRRPGDPPSLVAANRLILEKLDWRPDLDDLRSIVTHALEWEQGLEEKLAMAG